MRCRCVADRFGFVSCRSVDDATIRVLRFGDRCRFRCHTLWTLPKQIASHSPLAFYSKCFNVHNALRKSHAKHMVNKPSQIMTIRLAVRLMHPRHTRIMRRRGIFGGRLWRIHNAENGTKTSCSHMAHGTRGHGGVRPYVNLFIEGGRADL